MTARGEAATIDCGAGVRLERAVPCRMADGITLFADHYVPAGAEPRPTLLMRQPYGRDIASTVVYAHPVWFARQGYNVVVQDVRGRGDSEGVFYPFRHEKADGAATIAAIRLRPECNGKVGMYGFSYQGMTQLLAAVAQPEGLLCIAPAMAAHDLYRGWFYGNGALRLASTLGWGLQMLKADARRLGLCDESALLEAAWANLPAQYLATPYANHPALQSPALPTYVRDWMKHDRPGDFWSSMDLSASVDKIAVPALHISGWYDTYLSGTLAGFQALRDGAATAQAREHQYLLAGPWVHIPWGDRIGRHALGPEANLDTDALHLRWFNHWLKGSGEFASEPRVRHFALNANRWHSAGEWPAESTHTLYLHSGGRANSSKGDGTLDLLAPIGSEPPDLFVYDPEVPVAAPGGLGNIPGPMDQALLELGNNLLVYTGPPLTESLHVFGTPEVELHATISAAHGDFTAKLICLRPTAEAMFISIGIARSQSLFPDGLSRDQPHLWRIPLEPTSCVFFAGDRVRLEIASSAYPLFDRNPGNDSSPRSASPWNWERSTQTVFLSADRPSSLHLPVVRPEHPVEAGA